MSNCNNFNFCSTRCAPCLPINSSSMYINNIVMMFLRFSRKIYYFVRIPKTFVISFKATFVFSIGCRYNSLFLLKMRHSRQFIFKEHIFHSSTFFNSSPKVLNYIFINSFDVICPCLWVLCFVFTSILCKHIAFTQY